MQSLKIKLANNYGNIALLDNGLDRQHGWLSIVSQTLQNCGYSGCCSETEVAEQL
jgi:hypothetical protein